MNTSINRLIYNMLIFLTIFTDSVFSKWMGFYGRSAVNVFLPILFLLYIVINRRLVVDQFSKKMLFLLVYLIVVNIISNTIWMFEGNSVIYHGNNIWVKSFTQCIHWLNCASYILLLSNCMDELEIEDIFRPFVPTFCFLGIILMVELFTIPYAFIRFHHSAYMGYYERVRLLTSESSTTVPLIVTFGLFSIFYYYFCKNRIGLMLMSFLMVFFVISSGSKTIYFCVLIVIIVNVMMRWHFGGFKGKMFLIFVIIAASTSYLLYYLVANADIRGSTYTLRPLSIIAATETAIRRPFGLGGAVYFDTYLPILRNLYTLFRGTAVGASFSFVEIEMALNDSENEWGVIAGFFNSLLNWGIIGGVIWVRALYFYLKESITKEYLGKGILLPGLICIIFMIFFTVPFMNIYISWAYIAIMGYIFNSREKRDRLVLYTSDISDIS